MIAVESGTDLNIEQLVSTWILTFLKPIKITSQFQKVELVNSALNLTPCHLRERFWNNEVEWTRRVGSRKGEILGSGRSIRGDILTYFRL